MHTQAKVKAQHRFHWFSLVIAEYSVCNLGHFAVMAILSLYFVHSLNLPSALAGGMMLFASLSFRLSRIFLAPLINRLPVRSATCMALFMTSLGYLGMSIARTPFFVFPLLLMVGIGHGSNSLLVKTMAAHSSSSDTSKKSKNSPFLRYASLTTGINLTAAIGSFVGSALLFHWTASSVFLLASFTYGVSGLIALWLPSSELGESKRPAWRTGLQLSLKVPALWRAMLFACLGWFLYTQSYASLPLFVSEAAHHPELLGTVFSLNAVLVVVGQLPLSKAIIRLRLPTSQLVLIAFLSFAAGFALLWFFPSWLVVYGAVVLWTVGEMLLMPALDTLVAEGALFEHKQVAFTLNSVAVGIGEGFGNLIGVAIAGWLLTYGDIHYLYTLLTLVAMAAMIVTILVGNRRESMVHRLFRGQPLRPTGQTELLHLLQPSPQTRSITQTLLTWLSAPSLHEERSFFEAHPELLTLQTENLNDVLRERFEQPEAQTLLNRLRIVREVQSMIVPMIRTAYINMHGGLVLELPPWLEEIKQQLYSINKEGRPDQTAYKRQIMVHQAIERSKTDRNIAPETLAELQLLYAIACLELPIPARTQVMEETIQACHAVLQVYTSAHYPYQYARAQVFLSLAYLNRTKGERRNNFGLALSCYNAAFQSYICDSNTIELAALQATQNSAYARYVAKEKQTSLQQAIACCQDALRKYRCDTSSPEWFADQHTQVLSTFDYAREENKAIAQACNVDDTLKRPKVKTRSGERRLTHVEWITRQSTQLLS